MVVYSYIMIGSSSHFYFKGVDNVTKEKGIYTLHFIVDGKEKELSQYTKTTLETIVEYTTMYANETQLIVYLLQQLGIAEAENVEIYIAYRGGKIPKTLYADDKYVLDKGNRVNIGNHVITKIKTPELRRNILEIPFDNYYNKQAVNFLLATKDDDIILKHYRDAADEFTREILDNYQLTPQFIRTYLLLKKYKMLPQVLEQNKEIPSSSTEPLSPKENLRRWRELIESLQETEKENPKER